MNLSVFKRFFYGVAAVFLLFVGFPTFADAGAKVKIDETKYFQIGMGFRGSASLNENNATDPGEDSFDLSADNMRLYTVSQVHKNVQVEYNTELSGESVNLLDAVRNIGIEPLIHMCSSAEVYGQVEEDMVPITEDTPFNPASPYAVSKVGQDLLGNQYHLSYGMKILRTRMFTHTGPRRGDFFAESAFAKQIAEVEQGIIPNPIKVGNLDSIRTYADVRDAVRAYWRLLEYCTPGQVYNIGGNRTLTIGEVLDILKSFSNVPIEHTIDSELLRPTDVTLQIPENTKFRDQSGWRPRFLLEQTLEDLLNYHRARTKLRTR